MNEVINNGPKIDLIPKGLVPVKNDAIFKTEQALETSLTTDEDLEAVVQIFLASGRKRTSDNFSHKGLTLGYSHGD